MSELERSRRFREIALPHLTAAYNLARWLTRDDQDAQDVVQEACVRALRSCDGFRGESARPWLLAIVRNACFDWLRRNRPGNGNVAYDEELHGEEAASATMDAASLDGDPAAILARADARRLVNAALARLPVEYREVIVLRDIEDMSYREIAMVTAIPMGTVMSRLSRGRRMLAAFLKETLPEGGDGM